MQAEKILIGKRILVIDSDDLFLRAMRMVFRMHQIEGEYAIRPDDALILLAERSVDAIIVNIQFEDVIAPEFCRRLRKQYPLVPIIVITALKDVNLFVQSFEAGADDYVTKPPNTKTLLQRLANSIARYEAEKKNIELRKQLESYIPASAISDIARPSGVHSINAAILFSDMRGFTAATFDHAVEKVFSGINEAMTMQSNIIREHGGYIDGFAGDGMLAIFESSDCCHNACSAAEHIIRQARRTRVDIWDPLPIGIGINHGTILRGNLGSHDRKAHTVIGSAVNVSARLCGVAQATEAICSEYIMNTVGSAFSFGSSRLVQLKGIPSPIKTYPLDIK